MMLPNPLFNAPTQPSVRSVKLLCDIIREIHRDYPPSSIVKSAENIRVEFAKDGKQVRKVNKRSNYRVTGFLPSRKNNSVQSYESQIELAGLLFLEACPLIKSYQVQPAKIFYSINGKERFHIPDVILELNTGKMMFLEFKDINCLNDNDLLDRTRLLTIELARLGYIYAVIFPDQMPAIIMNNAQNINRHAASTVAMDVRENIKSILGKFRILSIASLLDILVSLKISKGHIYELIRQGDIQFDWTIPLTGESLIIWGEFA